MRKAVSIFAIVILALSFSCTEDVDKLKYPEYKEELVISGYLSPGDAIHYISVGYNQMLYSGFHGSIDFGGITGTLSDGANEITLRPVFHKIISPSVQDSIFDGFVFASSEMPVEEGKTYTLKVSSERGLYAESSCTVPFKKDLVPALDTVRVHPYYNYPEYTNLQADLSFTDAPGEKNYYALFCEESIYPPAGQPSMPENLDLANPDYRFFDDRGIDGKRLKIRLGNIRFAGKNDSIVIKIYLLNTDKAYFDYQRSILNYVSGEIPFTEASPVYSNVSGGLGIFAAYTYDSIIVRIR